MSITIKQYSGLVVRFNARRGSGAVRTADGHEFWFHHSDVDPAWKSLDIGLKVYFVTMTDDSNIARRVSPLRSYAFDVCTDYLEEEEGMGRRRSRSHNSSPRASQSSYSQRRAITKGASSGRTARGIVPGWWEAETTAADIDAIATEVFGARYWQLRSTA